MATGGTANTSNHVPDCFVKPLALDTDLKATGCCIGQCCSRFCQAVPFVGCIIGVFYCSRRRVADGQLACVWSAIGLIPFLNVWRLIVIAYRYCTSKTVPSIGLTSKLDKSISSMCGRNLRSVVVQDDSNQLETQQQEANVRAVVERIEFIDSLKDKRLESFPSLFFANWMSYACIRDKRLYELCIPGSHDSGSYRTPYCEGIQSSWAITQDRTFLEQLRMGIRFFSIRLRDLRKQPLKGYMCANRLSGQDDPSALSRVWIAHTFLCVPLVDLVDQLSEFINGEGSTEVVILSVRSDTKQLSADAWKYVLDMFNAKLKGNFISYDETDKTVYELVSRKSHILLLIESSCTVDNDISIPRSKMLTDSWSKTRSTDSIQLSTRLKAYLIDNRKYICKTRRIYVLKCEITPDANVIINSIFYARLETEMFRNLREVAEASHVTLVEGLVRDWEGLRINVVSCDFVRSDIIFLIVRRNFENDCDMSR